MKRQLYGFEYTRTARYGFGNGTLTSGNVSFFCCGSRKIRRTVCFIGMDRLAKWMEDQYKHPERELYRGKVAVQRKRREEFWESYAEMEMMDIFSGKDK